MKDYVLFWENREISVSIKRSARKSSGLEVRTTGEVLARVPNGLSDAKIKEFIENHKDWIIRKVLQMSEKKDERQEIRIPSWEKLTLQERRAIKEKISVRVVHYSQKMNVSYGRITIRNQKTRWGSCSSKGNLNFNYRLFYLPEELLDYVVVHELAHRRYMNHSRQFWQEVSRYFPQYEQCRRKFGCYKFSQE